MPATFHTPDDAALEMARLVRECEEAVRRKLAARQLGELFYDLQQQPKESSRER
jgi:hypothetical protein